MKQKILSLSIVFFFMANVQAQTSYGIKAGVNLSKFSNISYLPKENRKNNLTFHVTTYADIPVASNFSVQPGVSLQGKGNRVKAGGRIMGLTSTQLMSVEIPANLVYYIPMGAVGSVFVGSGPYVGFNIRGKNKFEGEWPYIHPHIPVYGVTDPEFTSRQNELQEKWAQGEADLKFTGNDRDLNLIDVGVNFLIGFRLADGFLINAGYGLGLSNLIPNEQGDGKYSNRVLSFGVGFEF